MSPTCFAYRVCCVIGLICKRMLSSYIFFATLIVVFYDWEFFFFFCFLVVYVYKMTQFDIGELVKKEERLGNFRKAIYLHCNIMRLRLNYVQVKVRLLWYLFFVVVGLERKQLTMKLVAKSY